MSGKAYEGLRKNKQSKKWEYVAREGRKLADRKDLCGKRCTDTSTIAACPKITDDERKELFESYWRMNWDQRRIYIGSMVTSRIPNGNPERLKKSCILKYNFRVNGVLIPVCKKFFLQTLGMGEWSVRKWSSTTAATNITTPVQKLNLPNRSHGNKDRYALAKQFLDSLPKLPSHYSRAESNKEYLEPVFERFARLYEEYTRCCTENDQPLASRTILRSVFKDMNVSLFSPKKDQCDTCASHKAGNITEEEFAAHLRRKEEARDKKKMMWRCVAVNMTRSLYSLICKKSYSHHH